MISLDIENTVLSIPIDKVIEQSTNVLLKRLNNCLSDKSIKQLFLYCTKGIALTFNNELYQQTKSLTIGFTISTNFCKFVFFTNEKTKILT